MATLVERHEGGARARESTDPNWQESGVLTRTLFKRPDDPGIGPWADKAAREALKEAGGDAQKAKIIVPVTLENPKEENLNRQIGQALEDALVERGMVREKVRVIVEAMDFGMLASFVNGQNWESVRQRMPYAVDRDGKPLLNSKYIEKWQAQAIISADTQEKFVIALQSLGDTEVFFPEMTKDQTITGLYDEMRKATIRREREKEQPPPQKEPAAPKIIDITSFQPVKAPKAGREPVRPLEIPEPPPAPDWLDASVQYQGGTPMSTYRPGSMQNPPLAADGGLGEVNKIYSLNNLLGIHTPLQSLEQLKKDQQTLQQSGIGSLFDQAYFDGLRYKPASYASRLMKSLFDFGSQIKIGKLEKDEKLYVSSSIPMLPIRGTLPLMDGVAFSLYHCGMLSAAWTRDWFVPGWEQVYAQTDIRLGVLYSYRSMSGATDERQKPAAFGLKLMDDFRTVDNLPEFTPLGMLDARIIYKQDVSQKISLKGSLTFSAVGSMVSGGWPATLLEGEAGLKKIMDNSFAALDGGVRLGWNVPAMEMEELSGYLQLTPKNRSLPVFSAGASRTRPLKGDLNNIWAKLEESFKLGENSSLGVYVKGGATLYPKTSDRFDAEHATNIEFGISWRGILEEPKAAGEPTW
ncbi:Uncharacterised protein [uncultured archaeon]|nr:Uncharacterised protein [uncultured archaeon]